MKKIINFTVITISLLLLCISCTKKEDNEIVNHTVKSLYEKNNNVVKVEYNGLNIDSIKDVNDYEDMSLSSFTFGAYDDGNIAGIKNLELDDAEYCGFEINVKSGENVKYPFWGIAYKACDSDFYYNLLENGMDDEFYNMLPFMTSDAMSFGYSDEGDRSSLYVSLIKRYEPLNDSNVLCTGTYPNALFNCQGQSVASLVAANCVTVDEALAFMGALDEQYNMLFPSVDPSISVNSTTSKKGDIEYVNLYAYALEDSSGRHGVVEYIDNKPIWHEGEDSAFNFFIQEEYLLNEDETYKEKWGKGIGRYNALSSLLDNFKTMDEHSKWMNSIERSQMTSSISDIVDWRSEFSDFDVFENYDKYINFRLDTKNADELYPLYAHYLDSNTNMIVLVNSYESWLLNKDHLKNIYDLNYCIDEANKVELTNLINWYKEFYNGLSNDEKKLIGESYKTYVKVFADPMNYRITRWFNEEITSADTINFKDICDSISKKTEE